MPNPFIDDNVIELSAFARYVETTVAEQVGRDCGEWKADAREAIALGDLCRHMRGHSAHARAFYEWALAYLEEHPEADRGNVDLASRYALLGDLCSELSDLDAAMDAWGKSLDNGSEDPVPYLRLACGLARGDRAEEARARIDGLFALGASRIGRLDPEQRRLAEWLRSSLPVAQGAGSGQDLRTRVRELLVVAERSYGRSSGLAEHRTQGLR